MLQCERHEPNAVSAAVLSEHLGDTGRTSRTPDFVKRPHDRIGSLEQLPRHVFAHPSSIAGRSSASNGLMMQAATPPPRATH
jgi:hypothetical protein